MTNTSNFTLILISIMGLAACAPSGGSSGGSAAALQGTGNDPASETTLDPKTPHETHEEVPDDGSVKLKRGPHAQVMIDSRADLRTFVFNPRFAKFEITKNASLVRWISLDHPILHFQRAGTLEVTITDIRDRRTMKLHIRVVFDTAGIPPDLDPTPIPFDPPIPL